MFKIAISLDDQDENVCFIKARPDMYEFVCEDCGTVFPLSEALRVVQLMHDVKKPDGSFAVYTFFLIRIEGVPDA